MKTVIGSQLRETLDSCGYHLWGRPEKGVDAVRDTDGHREIWYASNDHAGYTIQIGRWGYEYGRDCKEWEYI